MLVRESHGDQRDGALGSEAPTPGVAAESKAEFPDPVAHMAEREPSDKGA
jgi:hypothetical protein